VRRRLPDQTPEAPVRVHTVDEIAALVQQTRKQSGISQQALADRIGASRQWVQRLEAGVPGIELGLTLRTLTALGIQLDLRASASAALDGESKHRSPGTTDARANAPVGWEASKSSSSANTVSGWTRSASPNPVDVPDINAILQNKSKARR